MSKVTTAINSNDQHCKVPLMGNTYLSKKGEILIHRLWLGVNTWVPTPYHFTSDRQWSAKTQDLGIRDAPDTPETKLAQNQWKLLWHFSPYPGLEQSEANVMLHWYLTSCII